MLIRIGFSAPESARAFVLLAAPYLKRPLISGWPLRCHRMSADYRCYWHSWSSTCGSLIS